VRGFPTLVADAREAWRWGSVRALALLLAAPDIHAGIVAMGWLDEPEVPASVKWAVRGLAALGLAYRLIQQKAKPAA
jgi:hypothetical protein